MFNSSPTEFSVFFPRDASSNKARNLSLQSPLKIQEQTYILGGELPELSSDEIELLLACDTVFNFSQHDNPRKVEEDNEGSMLSLKSDDIFTGSLSSLERTLFGNANDSTECRNPDPEKTPESSALMHQNNKVQTTPFKRKQDLTATRQGQMKFIDNTSRPITRFHTTRSCRQLTYQDEYLRLAGIDDNIEVSKPVKSIRCPGCSKMFKKLQQHKCKVLTITTSDSVSSTSFQNNQKFMCKTCKKTFRSEPSFRNHLSSHLKVKLTT